MNNTQKQPNIIFILSDDHGSWATGCYGNQEVITPNIDKIANQGITFNNFFCTSPVCSPARASILTGKIPSQHGVHDWLNGGNLAKEQFSDTKVPLSTYEQMVAHTNANLQNFDSNLQVKLYETERYAQTIANEKEQIPYLQGFPTFSSVLANNGYTCGFSGKWHLGATATKQAGFSFWKPISKGGTDYMFPEIFEDGKIVIKEQYVSEYIADNAIDFLNSQTKEQPFLLCVNFTAPHSPWRKSSHPSKFWDLYDDCLFSTVGDVNFHKYASPTAPYPKNKKQAVELMRGYYTAISAMDDQIGRILKQVEANALDDNTIIVYCSDNGMNLGQHGVWGKGNGTFPLNFYEESIKVPFVYYDPRTNINKIENSFFSQYDIFPTIIDVCGINYKFDSSFPGNSFYTVLNSSQRKDHHLVVFDEYGANRMIRSKRFKYIYRTYFEDELYDLENDSSETINLINDKNYQEQLNSLKTHLNDWFSTYTTSKYDGQMLSVSGFGQFTSIDKSKAAFSPRQTF